MSRPHIPHIHPIGLTLAAAVAACGVLAAVAGAGAAPVGPTPPSWPGETVVAIEGDAANGFSIHRLDGSSDHPPTRSETTAECEEYDTEIGVEVCLAETRAWFDALAEHQLSLSWALSQRSGRADRGSHPAESAPSKASAVAVNH